MGFRTLEISQACELHIKNRQLVIESDSGIAYIPIEDLNHIMVHGANIRLSTMDLSILTQNKVALTTLDNRYLPTAIVLPFDLNYTPKMGCRSTISQQIKKRRLTGSRSSGSMPLSEGNSLAS